MFHLSPFHLSVNAREYLQKARKTALLILSYVFLDNQLLLRGVGVHYSQNYNYGHNILRIFDVLPNFPFITCETKPDY